MAAIFRSAGLLSTLKNSTLKNVVISKVSLMKHLSPTPLSQQRTLLQPIIFRNLSAQQISKEEENYRSQSILNKKIANIENIVHKTGRVDTVEFKTAFKIFSKQNQVLAGDAMLLLRCCGELMPQELPSTRNAMVQEIWEQLQRKGTALDTSHYNALLKIYLENEHEFAPAEFLDYMQKNGVEPNRVTYQRLILRYCQLADIDGATKILEHMKEKGLQVNEQVFYALMLGYSRAGDMTSAVSVIDMMQQSGLEPNVETYLTLAVVNAEQGLIDDVFSTIDTAESKQQTLNDQDLLDIIYALASKGHSEHVPKVLEKTKKTWGYNQDCMNVIYKLINANCLDAAFDVYQSMTPLPEDSVLVPGVFYVKHLVKCQQPLEKIVEFANKVSPRLRSHALQVAIELDSPLVHPLMELINEEEAMRPHYFWPIIANARNKTAQDVYDVIGKMHQLEVPVSRRTLAEYAIPVLVEKNESVSAIINKMKEYNINEFQSVNALVHHFIYTRNPKNAVQTLRAHPFRLVPALRRLLVLTTKNTKAFNDAAIILGQMALPNNRNVAIASESDSSSSSDDSSTSEDEIDAEIAPTEAEEDVVGMFLREFAYNSPSEDIENMLEAVKARGLKITPEYKERITGTLRNNITPQISSLLSTLASGELQRVSLPRAQNQKKTTEHLEKLLAERREQNLEVDRVQVELLMKYARGGEVDKAEAMYSEIKANPNTVVSVGCNVVLMNMYLDAGNLQKAQDIFNDIRAENPDTSINLGILLKLATAMYKAGLVEECLKFLETEAKKSSRVDPEHDQFTEGAGEFGPEREAVRLLAAAASAGNIEYYERLEKTLFDSMIPSTHRLRSKKIELYCNAGEVDKAFEYMKKEKEITGRLAFKGLLLKEFIKKEDSDKLQELWEMSSALHGESNALLDLAIAFIEEGRLQQAKKLLSTRGLRLSEGRINYWSQQLITSGKIKCLEDFLTLSTELLATDRRALCHNLIQAYDSTNDAQKALDLWTLMQEQSILPSNQMLIDLRNLLQRNDITPPFQVEYAPEQKIVPDTNSSEIKPKEEFQEFKDLVNEGELEKALDIYRQQVATLPNFHVMSLFNAMMKEGRLDEVYNLVKENSRFRGKLFRRWSILDKMSKELALAGRMDDLFYLYDESSVKDKKVFTMSLVRAAVNANRTKECFDKLSSDTIEHESVTEILSPPAVLCLLEADPSILPDVQKLAMQEGTSFKTKNKFLSPLWSLNFLNGKYEEAQEQLEVIKANGLVLPFTCICYLARSRKDTELLSNFMSKVVLLPEYQEQTQAKSATYNCWIDILLTQDKVDEAIHVVENALKVMTARDFFDDTLKNLNVAADKAGLGEKLKQLVGN